MKHIGLGLLTLLISLSIFSGCDNPQEIGLDVTPADQVNTKLVDTSTVRAVTVREDSLNASGLTLAGVGYINDPAIGVTESNLAVALSVPTIGYNYLPTAKIDSAVLVLPVAGTFYGSVLDPVVYEVHQLAEKYLVSSSRKTNKKWAFEPTVLGSQTTNSVRIKDSLTITDIITGKPDTTKKVGPQLRIRINPDFVQKNLIDIDSSYYKDNKQLTNYIKGLYITTNRANGKSGMAFFDLTNTAGAGLSVYYKTNELNKPDTIVAQYAITKDSSSVNIAHTYNTTVQTQLNNPKTQETKVFVQPMGGLRTKIAFPYIDKLKSLGKIIINKAELVAYIDGGSDADPFTPAPRLFLYRTDIAGQRQLTPDNTSSDRRFIGSVLSGGYYNQTLKRYTFVLTSYIQDILAGKLTQYDTYIAAIYANESNFNPQTPEAGGGTAIRSILGTQTNPFYKMKLNITYTVLK